MACNSAHAASGWIMHDTAQDGFVSLFRRCDPVHFRLGRQKAAIVHFQWAENVRRDKFIQWSPTHAVNNFPQHNKVDITVTEGGSRLSHELLFASEFNPLVVATPLRSQRKIRAQS